MGGAAIFRNRSAKRRSARAPTRSATTGSAATSSSSGSPTGGRTTCRSCVGRYNFDRIRYEYYRDRTASFEAFKKGAITFREEFTSRHWATGYDFPAVNDGRVIKDIVPDGRPAGAQGWFINMRRPKFADPRVRLALTYAFDFEWINKNIMFGSYQRTASFFENSPLKAEGEPSADELALLEPLRGKVPDGGVWRSVRAAGLRRFGPRPRHAAKGKRASDRGADASEAKTACSRPTASRSRSNFSTTIRAFEPHINGYIAGLKLLGIEGNYGSSTPRSSTSG